MKQLKRIMIMLAALSAFACTKAPADGNGHVSFVLDGNYDVADKTKSAVSSFTDLPASGDFTLSITDKDNAVVWTGKVDDWDPAAVLRAGSYTVTATYGSLEAEGFDKPYFTGTTDFEVRGGQTTEVKVNVSLGNTVILVTCTDNFRNYYRDYSFKLTRNNAEIVSFVKDETRAAFVDAIRFTMEGTLVSETNTKTFSRNYSNLDVATAYTFVFDASNVGGASISVSFDNTVETIELGDLELND